MKHVSTQSSVHDTKNELETKYLIIQRNFQILDHDAENYSLNLKLITYE